MPQAPVSLRRANPGPWVRGAQLDRASRDRGNAGKSNDFVQHGEGVGGEAIGYKFEISPGGQLAAFDEVLLLNDKSSYHNLQRGGRCTTLRIELTVLKLGSGTLQGTLAHRAHDELTHTSQGTGGETEGVYPSPT